jgi:hypothetical protein
MVRAEPCRGSSSRIARAHTWRSSVRGVDSGTRNQSQGSRPPSMRPRLWQTCHCPGATRPFGGRLIAAPASSTTLSMPGASSGTGAPTRRTRRRGNGSRARTRGRNGRSKRFRIFASSTTRSGRTSKSGSRKSGLRCRETTKATLSTGRGADNTSSAASSAAAVAAADTRSSYRSDTDARRGAPREPARTS